jgi:uncharacterized repeat protein (TIGR01451 family)
MGLGVALPFAAGAVPASAQTPLSLTKTHEGDFARGEIETYLLTLRNEGTEASGHLHLADTLPTGLTVDSVSELTQTGVVWDCSIAADESAVNCDIPGGLAAGVTFTFRLDVNVSPDAPCDVTNVATASELGGTRSLTASDPTTITGGECDGGDGGNGDDGGSILPVTLNGVLPMFNNITVNNNIKSPGASNNSRQNFGLNSP